MHDEQMNLNRQHKTAIAREIIDGTYANGVVINCMNPHSYCLYHSNDKYKSAMDRTDVILRDGAGVSFAYLVKFKWPPVRVTGFDICEALFSVAKQNCKKINVGLVGSTNKTLKKMIAIITRENPNVCVKMAYSPSYSELDMSEEMAHLISSGILDCDIVLVGLGAPKQEIYIDYIREYFPHKIYIGVGAVFDYLANNIVRPHKFVRNMGFEWLYRLVQQPRHIGPRIIHSNLRFFYLILTKNKFL